VLPGRSESRSCAEPVIHGVQVNPRSSRYAERLRKGPSPSLNIGKAIGAQLATLKRVGGNRAEIAAFRAG
jgi:hypothetical protein